MNTSRTYSTKNYFSKIKASKAFNLHSISDNHVHCAPAEQGKQRRKVASA
jgi:hypothetical protein